MLLFSKLFYGYNLDKKPLGDRKTVGYLFVKHCHILDHADMNHAVYHLTQNQLHIVVQ